jgi:hemerythrin superfamily protein
LPKSIKRHKSLHALSREHHHGLLLSWKIKAGLKKEIDPKRIKKYCDWFWESDLKAHFDFEEKYVFPILGKENPLIERALKEHVQLQSYFTKKDKIAENLVLIEKGLIDHIRFEERILFMEVEKLASPQQLARIEEEHSKSPSYCWNDEFWKNNKED